MPTTEVTLLIVDDDVPLRTAFSRALERCGYTVTAIVGAESEVVAQIEALEPSAILMDNHMPDANGIDLIAAIRTRWSGDELPIVLISGSSVQSEIDRAMAAGANDFRRKPVELSELLEVVDEALTGSSEEVAR